MGSDRLVENAYYALGILPDIKLTFQLQGVVYGSSRGLPINIYIFIYAHVSLLLLLLLLLLLWWWWWWWRFNVNPCQAANQQLIRGLHAQPGQPGPGVLKVAFSWLVNLPPLT